ncbi:MAG: cupin domain-containing protein [Calothrix sp. MO_167.B12]|nr:cupin domain-containing protein [Calothrix sp. MO_167.B12]
MMTTLQKILQPYSLESFLAENWAKQGIVIPGNTDKFQHLFSWQHLNQLLNFHKPDQLRFVLDHKDLPCSNPREWVKQCKKGASLVISHVNKYIPELADLSWALEQEIGNNVAHTNIYCSWPSYQGFKAHYDTHEVFIMQIDGQKEWFVFEDTFKYPYSDELSKYHKPPEGTPYINCILKPGDLLYIPRGHWHYAIAREQPSLHVTLGIRCLTGREVLESLFNKVQKNIQQESTWRQNLPVVPSGNTLEFETHIQHLVNSLVEHLQREKEKLSQECANSLGMVVNSDRGAEISLPEQIGFGLFEQGLDTLLRQAKFQKVKIERVDNTIYLFVSPSEKKLRFKDLPPKLIDALVDKVLNQESFTIRDVSQWLPECDLETHILPLLAGLVKEGILIQESPQRKIGEENTSLNYGIPKPLPNNNSNYALNNK